LSRDGVVAIPKTSSPDRLRENVDAQSITLDAATLARIDAAFPPPSGRTRISFT
jgi:diketogulonate reductase-like aldo/keto reductase